MSYPTTPSHATPKKRRLEDGQGSASANATPSSLRGALTGIRSWLSPWRGNSRTSAAFGHQDAEDERRQDESSQTLYPPIPSHATMPALNRRESPPPLPFTFTPPPQQRPDDSAAVAVTSSSSPLSRNYSLLARFFAEKAAEEAGTSTGADDDGNRLTEDEVEGCRILIEESGRSPGDLQRRMGLASEEQDSFEVPKRRLAAAPRRPRGTGSWLSPSPAAHSAASREGSALSFDRSPLARGFGSASASVLSHAMTDPGLSRRAQLPTSSSANPFLSGRTSSAQPPARRRRRPLYFGPGMSSTASPFAATSAAPQTRPAATTFTGAGKRQRVDDDVPPSTSIAQAWQPPPADRPMQPPRNAPAAPPAAPPAKAVEASQPPPPAAAQSSPAQSRTASAVLSILAQPDLARPAPMPVRRSTRAATSNSNTASTSANSSAASGFRPDGILNPYQASPELNLGQSSQSSMRRSRTSEAVAKMKDERRRSTRLRKSAAPEDSSAGDTSAGLLETIERTKPGGSSSSAARRSGTRDSSYATPTPEPPRMTFAQPAPSPSPSPSPSIGKTAAEKTAEAKRRLDAMSAASSDASSSSTPSGSESLSAPTRQAPATPPSFNFGKHAPPKPSRLSIAFNANDSPGNTDTADEEEEEAEERVTGEDSNMSMDIKSSQPVASAKSTFTFGGAMNKPSSGVASSGTTSKQSDGTSGGSQSASANLVAEESNTSKTITPSFSFGLPATTAPSPLTPASMTSRPASSSSSSTPREAALTTEAAALPKFDLQVSLSASTPSWYARSATTEEEQRRTKASSAPISELPSFDLLRDGEQSGGANGQSLTSKDEQRREKASTTSVAALPSFNLFGNRASQSPPAVASQAATSTPEASSPAAGEGAGEESSSSSALLGSGEGEEGETTVFEVRAKFWKFSGKWEDLGVGIARIKRSSTTAADQTGSPRRLLVRNAGNGAVTVNFNLFRDFKATQTGNSLSFTGFDAEGKGQPMRCKVKTAESAEEFAQTLEREAKLS